jgi:hypothetical protein
VTCDRRERALAWLAAAGVETQALARIPHDIETLHAQMRERAELAQTA